MQYGMYISTSRGANPGGLASTGDTMKKLIAIPAIALTAGISLAACGTSHTAAPKPAVTVTHTTAPAAAALPIASAGQTVTFPWPGSSPTGTATTWKMTVLGVKAI